MSKKAIGAILGFVMGFFMLHPLSMVFQGLVHPVEAIDLTRVLNAFNVHHLPMAFFFGALGAAFGLMNISYTLSLSKEKKRVKVLESLLPICAHCKKIRDDDGSGNKTGQWHEVEQYITMKTDTTFTHGMCPECYEKVMEEFEKEDLKEALHANEPAGT